MVGIFKTPRRRKAVINRKDGLEDGDWVRWALALLGGFRNGKMLCYWTGPQVLPLCTLKFHANCWCSASHTSQDASQESLFGNETFINQWECKYFQHEIKQNLNHNYSVQQSLTAKMGREKKKERKSSHGKNKTSCRVRLNKIKILT